VGSSVTTEPVTSLYTLYLFRPNRLLMSRSAYRLGTCSWAAIHSTTACKNFAWWKAALSDKKGTL